MGLQCVGKRFLTPKVVAYKEQEYQSQYDHYTALQFLVSFFVVVVQRRAK